MSENDAQQRSGSRPATRSDVGLVLVFLMLVLAHTTPKPAAVVWLGFAVYFLWWRTR